MALMKICIFGNILVYTSIINWKNKDVMSCARKLIKPNKNVECLTSVAIVKTGVAAFTDDVILCHELAL